MSRFVASAVLLFVIADVPARADDVRPVIQLNLGGPPAAKTDEQAVRASLVSDVTGIAPGSSFHLAVRFEVPKGSYFYYRSSGGRSKPTEVSISAPEGFTVGPVEFPGPEVKYTPLGKTTDISYVYTKSEIFVFAKVGAPAELTAGAARSFRAKVAYQWCTDAQCIPFGPAELTLELPVVSGEPTKTPFASTIEYVAKSLPIPADKGSYATVRAFLNQDKLRPKDRAQIAVVVDILPGHHLQMHRPPVKGLISTDVLFDANPAIKQFGLPSFPEGEPMDPPLKGLEGVREYRGQIVATVPIEAAANLSGSQVEIDGLFRYQACEDGGTCFPPEFLKFALTVPVAQAGAEVQAANKEFFAAIAPTQAPPSGPTPPTVGPGDPRPTDLGYLDKLSFVEENSGWLPLYLLYAFLGGLILNVMPCVLPVIAIKILGFVQQAGESRRRIFLLNLSYSLGVIAVFLALASFAVVAKVGWGGLFQSPKFNLVMAGLVFSMGLSLLGVFEIPVPGFTGGGAHREGLFGAFCTGILATLLATPCSGPFLGVTLGWSVRQPFYVTYLVWATMGLGMASPYLLMGAMPGAIKWLPRPGNWMVTFKEFSGLVLMGTVVYIITFLDDTYTLPMLVILVGLAFSFWMVGNLYDINSQVHHKRIVQIGALAVGIGMCVFGMTWVYRFAEVRRDRKLDQLKVEWIRQMDLGNTALAKVSKEDGNHVGLPWEPFSEQTLKRHLAEGTTVLVEFTADWCTTCQVVQATALDTSATRNLVDELSVATLYADYTKESEEIRTWLDKFNSISVPLTVVFPGNADDRTPIPLRDVYTQGQLHEALKKAGPSRKVGVKSASADRDAAPR